MSYAIETIDLAREFRGKSRRKQKEEKTVRALDGVSLQVEPGELFGLLGPNGAGKTTLIKILVTLLYPTSGTALVDGLDVTKDLLPIRQRINMVCGGEFSGYGILTVRETLWMFSQFYGIPYKVAFQRIDNLLDIVGLSANAHTKISKLSTGMRQKMNFCRGFVTDPKILFLDEPTLGMDVSAARDIRAYIQTWMADHPERNIMLTTHYMAEADELCNRVAIIDSGVEGLAGIEGIHFKLFTGREPNPAQVRVDRGRGRNPFDLGTERACPADVDYAHHRAYLGGRLHHAGRKGVVRCHEWPAALSCFCGRSLGGPIPGSWAPIGNYPGW
ncbi:MAG: ABC transporter ATP-binding protein [Coprothermobacterota bacterium]|nr:ABC transporter ATP-binding protein [Coprothermobacterota bacterium]